MDIRLPCPPRLDLVFLRYIVPKLDVRAPVQPEVGLLVGVFGSVWIGGQVPMCVRKSAFTRARVGGAGGAEEAEGGLEGRI